MLRAVSRWAGLALHVAADDIAKEKVEAFIRGDVER